MIFGKSYQQKHKRRQEKLKRLQNKIWFAWYPIRENHGRFVWLQKVKVDYGIYRANAILYRDYKRPIYHLI